MEQKIIVFGAGAVGKSAFTIQFVHSTFVKDYDPTIEDVYKRPLRIGDDLFALEITDTAGQDDFAAMRTSYIRQGNGFILIYAIDDRSSFEEIEQFHKELVRTKGNSKVPCVICGHKCDLDDSRQISKYEGEELAHKLSCIFYETSAKSNINIDKAFESLVLEIFKNTYKPPPPIVVPTPVPSGGCCIIQ